MSGPFADLEGVTVVVAGAFNAAVFSPAWLLGQGLIGVGEYEAAEIEVITREIAIFTVGWLRVQVTPDSLNLGTLDLEEYPRVRDVAAGVLMALSHTPITAMGINHEAHFQTATIHQWHQIGDAIVPKQGWDEVLHLPGMRASTILGTRPDLFAGHVQVRIEPSMRVPRAVFVNVNDHFLLRRVDHVPESRSDPDFVSLPPLEPKAAHIPIALEILESEWQASEKRARSLFDKVLSLQSANA